MIYRSLMHNIIRMYGLDFQFLNSTYIAMLTVVNWLREKRLNQSGRQDLNLRPLRPERSALAKLSYSPKSYNDKYTITAPKLQ